MSIHWGFIFLIACAFWLLVGLISGGMILFELARPWLRTKYRKWLWRTGRIKYTAQNWREDL